jgi:hypothetical protein
VRNAKSLAYGCLLLAWSVPAWCGTDQAAFTVQIRLDSGAVNVVDGDGYCINRLLSEQTNAVVTVVCNSNQFVSIRAQAGKPFPGTHGGAHLFFLGTDSSRSRSLANADNAVWRSGYGTTTSMRIFFSDDMKELREMLVTF